MNRKQCSGSFWERWVVCRRVRKLDKVHFNMPYCQSSAMPKQPSCNQCPHSTVYVVLRFRVAEVVRPRISGPSAAGCMEAFMTVRNTPASAAAVMDAGASMLLLRSRLPSPTLIQTTNVCQYIVFCMHLYYLNYKYYDLAYDRDDDDGRRQLARLRLPLRRRRRNMHRG